MLCKKRRKTSGAGPLFLEKSENRAEKAIKAKILRGFLFGKAENSVLFFCESENVLSVFVSQFKQN